MRHERISVDPNVMVGKPVIKGRRITVKMILRMLGKGYSIEELHYAFPGLFKEHIWAVQSVAADGVSDDWAIGSDRFFDF